MIKGMRKMYVYVMFSVLFLGLPFLVTHAAHAGILYATDDNVDAFYTLNTTTGAATSIGSTGQDLSFSGLAYDTSTRTMYVSDVTLESGWGLGTIDLTTGAVTVIGSHVITSDIHGLAYDPISNVLYGSDIDNCSLDTISRATGAATIVGVFGGEGPCDIRCLAFDVATDTIYGMDLTNLYTINNTTGTATVVGPHGIPFGWYIGCEIDSDTGIMYAAGAGSTNLYRINKATGAATVIGPTGLTTISGLASVPTGRPAPTCTYTSLLPTSPTNIGTLSPGLYMGWDPLVLRPFGLEEASGMLTGRLWLPCWQNGNVDIYLVLDAPPYGGKFMLSEFGQWLSFPANIAPWLANTSGELSVPLFSLLKSGILPGTYGLDVIIVPSGTPASTISQIVSGSATASYYKWSFTKTLP